MQYLGRKFKSLLVMLMIISLVFADFGPMLNWLPPIEEAQAAPNWQMNYQGKLTDTSDVAVSDDDYNMSFKLCTDASCTSSVWQEVYCAGGDGVNEGNCNSGGSVDNQVAVTNGLFSIMLGSASSTSNLLEEVNFSQALYLEVRIGGTGATPSWETLTPRKILGAVPAAFDADKLDGQDGSYYATSTGLATKLSEADLIATTTWSGNLNVDGYVSSTDGLFTQDELHVGGLATIDDTLTVLGTTTANGFGLTGGVGIEQQNAGAFWPFKYEDSLYGETGMKFNPASGVELYVEGSLEMILGATGNIDAEGTAHQFGDDTGNVTFSFDGVTNDGSFIWYGANNYFSFQDNVSVTGSATTTDRFYAGNQLSVATSSPWSGYELAVAGDGVFTGNLNVLGNATSTSFEATSLLGLNGTFISDWSDLSSYLSTGGSAAWQATSTDKTGSYSLTGNWLTPTTTDANLYLPENAVIAGNLGLNTTTPQDILTVVGGNIMHTASTSATLVNSFSADANDIFIQDNYMYVAHDDEGLRIYDITDPEVPVFISGYDPGGNCQAVYVVGDQAFVAYGNYGIAVIDVSNPATPIPKDRISSYSTVYDVEVYGKYAYLARGTYGLCLVDISNPYDIFEKTCFDTDGSAEKVFVSGKYAYVADGAGSASAGEFDIIDISDPDNLTSVVNYNAAGSVDDVYVKGKYAFLAAGSSGLQILDISDPSNPSSVKSLDPNIGDAHSLTLAGDYLYLTDAGSYDGELYIFNIASTTLTHLIETITLPDIGSDATLGEVIVHGKYAYVADEDEAVRIIDINGLKTPTISTGNIFTGQLSVSENVNIGQGLTIGDGLNIGFNGLSSQGTINVMSTSTSFFAGSLGVATTTPWSGYELAVGGSVIISEDLKVLGSLTAEGVSHSFGDSSGNVTFTFNGLSYNGSLLWNGSNDYFNFQDNVIITGNATSTSFEASSLLGLSGEFISAWSDLSSYLSTGGSAAWQATSTDETGTAISGNWISPTSTNANVFIPHDMVIAGNLGFGTTTPSEEIYLNGGTFYHRPDNLTGVGYVTGCSSANDIKIQGNYAYVTCGGANQIRIYDISIPGSPVLISTVNDAGDDSTALRLPQGVFVAGNYAYVMGYDSSGNGGMQIINITDPDNPYPVGNITEDECSGCLLSKVYDVYVSGHYAYIVNAPQANDSANSGLDIIDISDPTNPTHVSTLTDAACDTIVGGGGCQMKDSRSIKVIGKYAYITGYYDNGVQILDISDPTNPTYLSSFTDAGPTELQGAEDIEVDGKYIYIASRTDVGIEIMDISNISSISHAAAITDCGQVRSLAISGNYLIASTLSSDRIRIYDITDPENPIFISYAEDDVTSGVSTLNNPFQIAVKGRYIYVASQADSGFQVIDFTGLDVSSASFGQIDSRYISVTENAQVANNLYVGNGLNVGSQGIYTSGPLSVSDASSTSSYIGHNLGIATTTPAYRLVVNSNNASEKLLQVATSTRQDIFTIDNRGYVGIGTSTPNSVLHVVGDSAGSIPIVIAEQHGANRAVLALNNDNDVRDVGMVWQSAGTNKWWLYNDTGSAPTDYQSDEDHSMIFANSLFAPMMTLTQTSLNLGVGTTTPDYRITVGNGSLGVDGSIYAADDLYGADEDATIYLGRNDSAWETLMWDDSDSRFELTDDFYIDGNATTTGSMSGNFDSRFGNTNTYWNFSSITNVLGTYPSLQPRSGGSLMDAGIINGSTLAMVTSSDMRIWLLKDDLSTSFLMQYYVNEKKFAMGADIAEEFIFTQSGLEIVNNATTSGYLTVGSAPTGALFSAGNLNVENNAIIGGYVSSTDGLFTQDELHVGGLATIDDTLTVLGTTTANGFGLTGGVGIEQQNAGAFWPFKYEDSLYGETGMKFNPASGVELYVEGSLEMILGATGNIDAEGTAHQFGDDTGNVTFSFDGVTNDGSFIWYGANNYFSFQDNVSVTGSATTTDRFYAGNQLSVATSSPWSGYELAVAGDGVFTGNLNVLGNATSTSFEATSLLGLNGTFISDWSDLSAYAGGGGSAWQQTSVDKDAAALHTSDYITPTSSDAFVYLPQGLYVDGRVTTTAEIIAVGDSSGSTPVSGSGDRLMWLPHKKAFRVGSIQTGDYVDWWNDSNIGSYSVAMGQSTKAASTHSFAMGYRNDITVSNYASIGGGYDNTISNGQSSFVVGQSNTVTAAFSSILGGASNTVSENRSTIAGGNSNTISNDYSFIGGGNNNNLAGDYSAILGGSTNQIVSSGIRYSSILGGFGNVMDNSDADYSTILGGQSIYNYGQYTTAGGRYLSLSAAADRSFVWGYSASILSVTQPDSFLIYNSNGLTVGLGTTSPKYGMAIEVASGDDGIFQLGTSTNTHLMVMDNTGRVAIGTTTPEAQLHVVDDPNTSSPIILVEEEHDANRSALTLNNRNNVRDIGITFQAGGVTKWKFFNDTGTVLGYDNAFSWTNENERLIAKLDQYGHMGISTARPSSTLHVRLSTSSTASPLGVYSTVDWEENIDVAIFEGGAGNTAIQLQTVNTATGLYAFADSNARNMGGMSYSHSNEELRLYAGGGSMQDVGLVMSPTPGRPWVAIGTTTPSAQLHVLDEAAGNTNLMVVQSYVAGSADTEFKIQADGDVYIDGTYYNTGADYAEYFYTVDRDLTAGEAVCIDIIRDNAVKRCSSQSDTNIIGIISSRPALVGNATEETENNPNYAIVAMLGQIPAKVSAENGAIRPGDSLTSASIPGYVMRANPGDSTVGVALESLASGQGTIQVMISRKNKSITVEEIEQQVTERIAAMEIEDEVELLVTQTIQNYDLDTEIQAIVTPLLAVVDSQLDMMENTYNSQLSDVSDLVYQNSAAIEDLQTSAVWDDLASTTDELLIKIATLEGRVDEYEMLIETLQGQMADLSDMASSTLALLDQLAQGQQVMQFLSNPELEVDTLVVKQAAGFQGELTVYGQAIFKGQVEFQDHLTVDQDSAGSLVVLKDATSTEVKFETEYDKIPRVVATLNSLEPVYYAVIDKSEQGFRLALTQPAPEHLYFDWIALVSEGEVLGESEINLPGCLDSEALNYNPVATIDDGSCQYPQTEVSGGESILDEQPEPEPEPEPELESEPEPEPEPEPEVVVQPEPEAQSEPETVEPVEPEITPEPQPIVEPEPIPEPQPEP